MTADHAKARPTTSLSNDFPEILEGSTVAIEEYIEQRLDEGRWIHTKKGLAHRGKIKPATVHQAFRVPRRMLRHTFATRLSAGGASGHFVTQMLPQGDSTVFSR